MGESTGPATLDIASGESADDYARLRRKLVQAIRHYCPGWLSDAGEDLVQTALIRVLEARRSRGDESRLPAAYLYKAAYTAVVNEIRRRRRRPEIPLDGQPDPHAEASPERALSARELGEAIRRCLARVLRDRKLAVTLHLQGYSNDEAAHILKFDRKRTRNLTYRGLADLQKCLASQGLTP
jgi:RNA polymerase sigma-70 factor (ECF subfamily)